MAGFKSINPGAQVGFTAKTECDRSESFTTSPGNRANICASQSNRPRKAHVVKRAACNLCLFSVLALAASACSTPQNSKDRAAETTTSAGGISAISQPAVRPPSVGNTPMDGDVSLRVSVEQQAARRATILGETNLPNNTELLVTVSSTSTNFTGQAKTSVQSGRFLAGPFGPTGGLQPGQYTVNVVMPIPKVQPDSVRAVIGENGEHLKGPLVAGGKSGPSVKVTEAFKLTSTDIVSGKEDANALQAALRRSRDILQELKALERQGRSMEPLRKTNDLPKMRRCADLMRENRNTAKDVLARAEALPQRVGFHLSVAARELAMCLTCSENAIQHCNMAQSTLKDAEAAVRDK